MQKIITVTYCDVCKEKRETIVPHGLNKKTGYRLNVSVHDELNNKIDICSKCLDKFLTEVTIFYYPSDDDINVRTFSLREEAK